jgi:hypothetical protein
LKGLRLLIIHLQKFVYPRYVKLNDEIVMQCLSPFPFSLNSTLLTES